MPFMVSRRRLEDGDYDAWKARFEDGANDRKAAGCQGVRRFRGSEDRHELMMIFEWDSIENALAYVAKKIEEKPGLAEARPDGSGLNLENFFMDEMEPLES